MIAWAGRNVSAVGEILSGVSSVYVQSANTTEVDFTFYPFGIQ